MKTTFYVVANIIHACATKVCVSRQEVHVNATEGRIWRRASFEIIAIKDTIPQYHVTDDLI